MAELRWILLIIGAVVVSGVYLWSRRQLGGSQTTDASSYRRSEPSLNSSENSGIDRDGLVADAGEPTADDALGGREPQSAGEDQRFREASSKGNTYKDLSGDEKIISLRVATKGGLLLNGMDVVKALMDTGLMHGSFQIFHRMAENTEIPVFSVASLLEPGTFELSKLENMNTPGLTFFMVLPGAMDGITVFDDMLATAREIAEKLNCELLDEKGGALTAQGAGYIRDEIIRYEHQPV
ncbi:MAG: cell division protein ZipA [Gammaproteobacteria bacterium]|nr:cell division protein ZipA [Gammaproteobacteria bacterium]